MKGHPVSTEKNIASCQKRCMGVPSCAHFSFWEPSNLCHIQNDVAVARTNQVGYLSGPPSCEQGGERELELASSALEERICYQSNSAFSPQDSGAHGSPPSNVQTPGECQARCRVTDWCAGFTYSILDSGCHLADSSAVETRNIINSIAGPAVCQQQITFSLVLHAVHFESLQQRPEVLQAVKNAVMDAVVSTNNAASDGGAPSTATNPALPGQSGASGLQPTITRNNQEVVFRKAATGGVDIGVILAVQSSLKSEGVQRTLWNQLETMEQSVANNVAQVSGIGDVAADVITARVLTAPRLFGGLGSSPATTGAQAQLKYQGGVSYERLASTFRTYGPAGTTVLIAVLFLAFLPLSRAVTAVRGGLASPRYLMLEAASNSSGSPRMHFDISRA